MNGFYGSPYQGMGLDQMGADTTMGDVSMVDLGDAMMGDGLDEIISQNTQEMQRRRTMTTDFDTAGQYSQHNRRASMMEFGSGSDGNLADFGFDPAPNQADYPPSNNMGVIQKASALRKARSKEDLNLNTAFSPYGHVFDNVQNGSAYSSPMHPSGSINLPHSSYMSTPGDISVNYGDPASSMSPMNFSSMGQQSLYTQSPIHATFSRSFVPTTQSLDTSERPNDEQTIMEKVAQMSMPGAMPNLPGSADTVMPNLNAGSGGATPSRSSNLQTMSANTPQHMNLEQMQGSNTPYSNAGMC